MQAALQDGSEPQLDTKSDEACRFEREKEKASWAGSQQRGIRGRRSWARLWDSNPRFRAVAAARRLAVSASSGGWGSTGVRLWRKKTKKGGGVGAREEKQNLQGGRGVAGRGLAGRGARR